MSVRRSYILLVGEFCVLSGSRSPGPFRPPLFLPYRFLSLSLAMQSHHALLVLLGGASFPPLIPPPSSHAPFVLGARSTRSDLQKEMGGMWGGKGKERGALFYSVYCLVEMGLKKESM